MNFRAAQFGVAVVSSAFLSACGDSSAPPPQSFAPPHRTRVSVKVTPNDVILLESGSGSAVLQFIDFTAMEQTSTHSQAGATYRLRYPVTAQESETVTNTLRESYDLRVKSESANEYITTPDANHQTEINVGGFQLEWSYADPNSGWLAYYTNQAALKLLPANAFANPVK